MWYLQLSEEVAHVVSEPHNDLCVQLGVVVFEDDPDVDVVLVVRAGPVLGPHVVDDEFRGQNIWATLRGWYLRFSGAFQGWRS